jgi:hypothetical protein
VTWSVKVRPQAEHRYVCFLDIDSYPFGLREASYPAVEFYVHPRRCVGVAHATLYLARVVSYDMTTLQALRFRLICFFCHRVSLAVSFPIRHA